MPAPVQRPRPPLVIAAEGTRAPRVAARHAEVWITIPAGRGSREDASRSVGECARLLDEHWGALGRDPSTVERACVIGWGGLEAPFPSAEVLQDCVGRYREAGVQRFVFCFGGAATPAPYKEWVAAGAWASPETLDTFAAQVISDLSRPSSGLDALSASWRAGSARHACSSWMVRAARRCGASEDLDGDTRGS